MPFDMSSFERDRKIVEPDIKSANCTAIFIGTKDPVSEIGISPLGEDGGRCHVDTDGLKDIFMDGFRKMGIQ